MVRRGGNAVSYGKAAPVRSGKPATYPSPTPMARGCPPCERKAARRAAGRGVNGGKSVEGPRIIRRRGRRRPPPGRARAADGVEGASDGSDG
jgi:hypothetical protein